MNNLENILEDRNLVFALTCELLGVLLSVYHYSILISYSFFACFCHSTFVSDPDKATRAKEALERKKREEGKRKAYEERMVRYMVLTKFAFLVFVFYFVLEVFQLLHKPDWFPKTSS